MALGMLATAAAGGMVGLGEAGKQLGEYVSKSQLLDEAAAIQKQRDATLAAIQERRDAAGRAHDISMVGVREDSRQAGAQADIVRETLPENIAMRSKAASGLLRGTLDAKIEEKKALGAEDTNLGLERFKTLAPVQRQEAIDTEVAKLTALATPEMLKATRNVALAKHIVDPSYTLIPNADGTVTTFDSKSGKTTGILKGPDGEPISIDATISGFSIDVPVGSAVWEGKACDLLGTAFVPTCNVLTVVYFNADSDKRGRDIHREAGLTYSKGILPSLSS